MLFQHYISAVESEIAAYEAAIAMHRAQIEQFNQAESVASLAIETLQKAIANIEHLAPLALASLKSTVLAMFNDGSTDGNGGNEPEPTPGPQPEHQGESCQINPDAHWETAQPDGTYWDFASPLACLLSDAPTVSCRGQSVDHACECENKVAEFVELVRVNDYVAYQRHCDGEIIAVYAGGSNKQKLRDWGDWLTRSHSVTLGYELRSAFYLNTKWELKLTAMTLAQIERLAKCDFSVTHTPHPQLSHPLDLSLFDRI